VLLNTAATSLAGRVLSSHATMTLVRTLTSPTSAMRSAGCSASTALNGRAIWLQLTLLWSTGVHHRSPLAWLHIACAEVQPVMLSEFESILLGLRAILKKHPATLRMQGKACFKTTVEAAFAQELEQLTTQALAAFETAGFISHRHSA
jgi:hypothetical protein